MDNELEIVKNDGLTTEVAKRGINTQYLGMIAGGVTMFVAGALLYKFVIDPMITKHRTKKELENISKNESENVSDDK